LRQWGRGQHFFRVIDASNPLTDNAAETMLKGDAPQGRPVDPYRDKDQTAPAWAMVKF
jgi:hypothetical protein